jgi:hypothetical protein
MWGYSVSLNDAGDIVVIGSPDNSDNGFISGRVRVYQYNGTAWNSISQNIYGSNSYDRLGYSTSINNDGNIIAIGAIDWSSSTHAGYVRVFQNINGAWNQIGSDIDGENIGDFSGYSVSLSGDGSMVAIGAIMNDGNTNNFNDNRGHIRVYKFNSSSWNQLGSDIDGPGWSGHFGHSVSLNGNGNIVAIGAPNGGSQNYVGVYEYNGAQWVQLGNNNGCV